MENFQRNTIQCEIYTNPSKAWLANAWFNLEQRSDANFFLSWLWIGSWLESFVDDFYVVEAKDLDRTIGLGIISKSVDKFLGIPYKQKYHLHRTGQEELDQIWIEYNDFLIDSRYGVEVRDRMLDHIYYQISKRHALVIGASKESNFSHIEELGLIKRTLWQTKNFSLDLHALKQENKTLLEHLSRNSRYQILRSIKKYQQQYGDIRIEKATDIEKAKKMLAIAKPMHLARWNRHGYKSGFSNQYFMNFHQTLIKNGMQSRNIELYHIKAGEHTISVIYNFNYNNHIYFYLCAINYVNTSSQFKPGLVSHYLLINKAYDENISLYDFMGGYSRYKKTFANTEGDLAVNLYEPRNLWVNMGHLCRDSKLKLKHKAKSNNKIPELLQSIEML